MISKNLKVFTGTGHPDLAKSICSEMGTDLGNIEIFKFANDNIFARIRENVRGKDIFFVQTCVPPVNDRFMEILIAVDAFRRASAKRITVVLPYYPYARTDKKDQPRVPITAKLVSKLLSSSGVDRILAMDLHAEQIQGFFDGPSDQLLAEPVLSKYFLDSGITGEKVVAVSPDTGSAQRVRRFAKRLNSSFAIIDKRRVGNNDKTEVINLVGDVKDKVAILVDDEIDTGGTMINSANALLGKGAKEVYTVAAHGIFSKDAHKRLQDSSLSGVIVTDTFPRPKNFPKLTVLSVGSLFADAIKAINEETSITQIFK